MKTNIWSEDENGDMKRNVWSEDEDEVKNEYFVVKQLSQIPSTEWDS